MTITRHGHASMSAFQPPQRLLATLSLRSFAPRVRNPRPPPRALVAAPHVPPPANLAVVGSGLCGLATAYHLLTSTTRYHRKRGTVPPAVTVISPDDSLTTSASAVAAGLLHPFTPRVKKLVWKARRGIAAAEHLLAAVQPLSDTPLYRQQPLLRLAVNDKLKSDFITAANRFPAEVEYLEPSETAHTFPQVNPLPAVRLPRAYVVDTTAYLKALKKACQHLGVRFVPGTVQSIKHILGRKDGYYDTVIVCAGAQTLSISDLSHVPITPCRGQNLILDKTPLQEVPVIGGKYVVPDYFGRGVLAGATFEYPQDEPMDSYLQNGGKTDPERATDEIRVPVERLIPGLFSKAQVLGARAGLRALPPRSEDGSIPIACRVTGLDDDVSVWVLTGLGSRGLLHHAYLGRVMAHAVIAGNEKLLPIDTRRFEIALGGQQTDTVEEDSVLATAVHSQ